MISKLDFIENLSRSNIIVDGLMDEKGETWETSEKKVGYMLEKNLGLDDGRMATEHANRGDIIRSKASQGKLWSNC